MTRIDPHSHFDDRQPKVRHWHLRFMADFDSRILSGEVTLLFSDADGVSGPLDLDTKGLAVHRVSLPLTGQDLPFELGPEEPILGRRLRVSLPAGTHAVAIAYETSPEAVGLQWLEPGQTEGGRKPFLFSQCQAIHARTLVPCQDTAAVRVTYTAEVVVPEDLRGVMAAAAEGDEPGPVAGLRTFRFRMPQPIPSYLLALAVGDLESRELGPRTRVWAEPATVAAAAWEFEGVEEMIATAEGLFGPYDWERFDLLVLPPAFPYGGMENPRLTFLTPAILAGDRTLVDVVVHELAHSWTGNRVTNATAEHFWLNEGFTVWAERKILRALRGDDASALSWAVGRQELDESLARFRDRPELTRLRTRLEGVDPDEAYSSIPYEKGARFVAALEREAGEAVFGGFLRAYLERFRFCSITTEQFCAFLEERLPGLLARVDAPAWLDRPGLPANVPEPPSPRLDRILALAAGWPRGERPDQSWVESWGANELRVYLQHLPRPLPPEDCAWLDRRWNLTARGNYEILVEWLVLALASGYDQVLDRVRAVLARVGRMKYLRPLYQALGRDAGTRAVARAVYREAAPHYHALSRRVIQEVLAGYPD